jgi:hypothetical protein
LQFVVIALVAESSLSGSSETIAAFGTPTVVHFCVALLIAGMLSAPWSTLGQAAIGLGAVGLGGLAYEAVVIRRARRQSGYRPVFEDWLWHVILPIVAYATIVGGAVAVYVRDVPGLFAFGAGALLLLFIGIHNSWDTVTYLALSRLEREGRAASAPAGSGARDEEVSPSPSPDVAEGSAAASPGAR